MIHRSITPCDKLSRCAKRKCQTLFRWKCITSLEQQLSSAPPLISFFLCWGRCQSDSFAVVSHGHPSGHASTFYIRAAATRVCIRKVPTLQRTNACFGFNQTEYLELKHTVIPSQRCFESFKASTPITWKSKQKEKSVIIVIAQRCSNLLLAERTKKSKSAACVQNMSEPSVKNKSRKLWLSSLCTASLHEFIHILYLLWSKPPHNLNFQTECKQTYCCQLNRNRRKVILSVCRLHGFLTESALSAV